MSYEMAIEALMAEDTTPAVVEKALKVIGA